MPNTGTFFLGNTTVTPNVVVGKLLFLIIFYHLLLVTYAKKEIAITANLHPNERAREMEWQWK